MSEGPREYELNFDAANELEKQAERAKKILERLAAHLAATEPQRGLEFLDLVEQEHVCQAAELLLGTAYFPAAHATPALHCVFISFSHEDEAFIEELIDRLAEVGVTYFKADRDVQPVSDWAEAIWEAIGSCRVFLSVLTPRFLQSDWCKFEGGAACASKKMVLPVLRYVEQNDVPEPFSRFQSMIVESGEQLDSLVEELKELCAG